jgi:glutaredoxin-like protein NrdH
MTKAMLSRRGVEFDVKDIENDPTALEELRSLGLMSVPVVRKGDKYVHGWNPTRVGELVGFEAREVSTTPEQMLSSMRTILDATIRAVAQVPSEMLTWASPDRDRPLRQLLHHMFRYYELGVDVDILGEFPARTTWSRTRDVPSFDRTERLVRYGEATREKFNAWFSIVDPQGTICVRSTRSSRLVASNSRRLSASRTCGRWGSRTYRTISIYVRRPWAERSTRLLVRRSRSGSGGKSR